MIPACCSSPIPDNPTSTYPDAQSVAAVMMTARAHGLAVIVDEIYRELAFEPARVPEVAPLLPDRTFITTGLSKSLALGGWRLGVVRLPASEFGVEIGRRLVAFGSEIWSCAAAPVAAAAEVAYSDPPELLEFLDGARAVHRTLSRAVHAVFTDMGFECRTPTAGFYLYPRLGRGDIPDVDLAEQLLDRHRIAVLHGSAFGDAPDAGRVRMATSLLCGATAEERWDTLHAACSGELLARPRSRRRSSRIAERDRPDGVGGLRRHEG